ncbi:hypothetical protein CFG65_09935 [Vibrio parahaemolyticus]|uniref:HGGxSTG domain-containing protein n=1 Tax=Vibrio parahaemolyticus TaxID=670 RepID=UPI000C290485|nr:HGGxSTG domain-containing protein [Vibrio parahaemolyticus]PJR26682.1 hypothetical protein CFG65_09935 [Vibrio parahaemolyticus]HAS6930309.1 hypothetical protein [Vibrio parahaemolyticus]
MITKVKSISDKHFDLKTLPRCGAKTRAGTPCKRRGTKANGRCKLHGGGSTGPKTRTGKITSSRNAGKKIPSWAMCTFTEKEEGLFIEALQAIQTIQTLDSNSPHLLNHIVEMHREALEVMKFAILKETGEKNFILLQAALDHYYQDSGATHLKCHIYYSLISHPQFARWRSQAQNEYLDEFLDKAATKEMKKVERDINKLLKGKCF